MDPKAATETLLRVWRIYMTWFAFFFTANLLVMSWSFGASGSGEGPAILSSAWIVIGSFGVITSSWMAIYTRQLGQLSEGQSRGVLSSGLPVSMLSWFAVFHSLALLVCTIGWVFLLIR